MDQGETVVIPKATSSPWGKTPDVAPCSLMSVMDEQLAKDLQDKEDDVLNSLQVDLPGLGNYVIVRKSLVSWYIHSALYLI